jgi:excisionase family DNA binding protein
MPIPVTLSVKDAITTSGLSRSTLYNLISEGRLEAIKFGRRTLIKGESLERLLASLPPLRSAA